jgi:hypothetical protein
MQYLQPPANANTHSTRTVIKNANQYNVFLKYVSVHSEDRNISKFPNSGEFEIELPENYKNVQSVRLDSWTFPSNYSVFSPILNNVSLTFKFTNAYNPSDHGVADPLLAAIFAGLANNYTNEYIAVIEPGFYTPDQMYVELQNKLNNAVTNYLIDFFTNTPAYNYALATFTGYSRFIVMYNEVGQKLMFGNKADQFTLTNDSTFYKKENINNDRCVRRAALPEFINWGLPSFLGFTRNAAEALSVAATLAQNPLNTHIDRLNMLPRLFYGEPNTPGGDGYWIVPDPVLVGSQVYFLEAPLKINLMGPGYFYMEIDGFNCIDETSPYNLSTFTSTTNETNGVVNAAFAKIPIPSTPITQWFDNTSNSYKWFNPPMEKIRRLKVKIRYHNGDIVYFGAFDFSFMLEFTQLDPQNLKTYSTAFSAN